METTPQPEPGHRFGDDRDAVMHLDERIIQRIHEIAGVYTLRILHWIMAGFLASALTVGGATVWATMFYLRVETLVKGQADMRQVDIERQAKSDEWRVQTDSKLRFLENTGGDRWRLQNQRRWAREMQSGNPTLKVPDPDEIVSHSQP